LPYDLTVKNLMVRISMCKSDPSKIEKIWLESFNAFTL